MAYPTKSGNVLSLLATRCRRGETFVRTAVFGSRMEKGMKGIDILLATARHVIDGIRKLILSAVFICADTKDGKSIWAKFQSNDVKARPFNVKP